MTRIPTTFIGLAAAGLIIAACGPQAEDPPPEPEAPATEAPAAEEPAPTNGEDASADATVVTAASTDLGEVLVDGDGMTLYMFDPDAQGPSTCYDDCAAAWPPLLTDGQVAGENVQDGLLDTVERDDGTLQVTYDGWPLYLWAGDSRPGDVNGQGVQDVWWVIAPDGEPLRGAEPEPAGGGGAYY